MECIIKGCEKPILAKGWCSAHYAKWRKYGHPLEMKQRQIHGATLLERWSAYAPDQGAGCWEWAGCRDPNGYGRLSIRSTPILAHRIAWELFRGPLNSEQHVLHRCDNPPCVRPEHLFLGDPAANCADKMAKKRHRYGVSRGASHGCAKLTEDDVRAIRASGEQLKPLAARYGVSMTTISDIRLRKNWRHLP